MRYLRLLYQPRKFDSLWGGGQFPCTKFARPDPTKSDAENQADLQKQIKNLKEAPLMILEGKKIRLEQAAKCHREEAEKMKQEFFQCGEPVINGSALFDQMEFGLWLENVNLNRNPKTVREDWAVATTFFAFRQSDGQMVGMVDVRHDLTVPFLQEYGGHIGYAVRPSLRRQGYAVEMLQIALKYCRSLGLFSVMLGCYAENTASIRTIEKCGGEKVREKEYLDRKAMYVYSIALI